MSRLPEKKIVHKAVHHLCNSARTCTGICRQKLLFSIHVRPVIQKSSSTSTFKPGAEFGRMAGVDTRHTARNVGHKCCAVGVIATERRYISGDVSRIAEQFGTANTECCRLSAVLVGGQTDSWAKRLIENTCLIELGTKNNAYLLYM